MADEMAVAEVSDLGVIYHSVKQEVRALKDINFRIAQGETLVMMGESGSGKSTLVWALTGLLPEKKGKIVEGGSVIHGRWSLVMQNLDTCFDPLFPMGDHLDEILDGAERRLFFEVLLKTGLKLGEGLTLKSLPYQLSGGMLARFSMALALAREPDLLIADEPTSALDVLTQEEILKLFVELKHEFGFGFLLITHDLQVARRVGDRIGIMFRGQLVEIGQKNELLRHPQNPYTRRLLESEILLGANDGNS